MKKKQILTLALAVILLCTLSVAGTFAFLTAQRDAVTNTFIAAGGGDIIQGGSGSTANNENFKLDEAPFTFTAATSTYGLDTTAARVKTQTYDKVVPNMVIPKDPKLTVNLVADVSAYVFVKVIDTTVYGANNEKSNLSYTIDSSIWTPLEGYTGVYVYNNGNAVVGQSDVEISEKSILTGDKVTAATAFGDIDASTTGMQLGSLSFEAYVCQSVGFNNAADAYGQCFGN